MQEQKGYSLVSQQIRDLITLGFLVVPGRNTRIEGKGFIDSGLEKRIQPASFEPTLSDEIFVLDAEGQGLLRPRRQESVYKTLLQIPSRKRKKKSIVDGFEVKSGFAYLAKLNEKISPKNGENPGVTLLRSSPKSSTGRLFPKTRFLVDYNPAFDDIYVFTDKEADMWALIQPLPFNLILWPGLTLNQIRFFSGNARLSDDEIREEFSKNPLLYEKKEGGEVPLEITEGVISDGLRLNLDALGINNDGVFGLRARRNPDPVDMAQVSAYRAEDYFEPVMGGQRNAFRRGQNYLVASNEVLHVPLHLSAELRRHAREGIEGRTHDAGFADPGFTGDVVLEITPDEETEVIVEHQMPLSSLEFFRTNQIPDKSYGEGIGSNYQKQTGPRVSKHFLPFDFETAARNHQKLSRIVLVEDSRTLMDFRTFREGFEPIKFQDGERLLELLNNGFWHSRYDCEEDELTLQPIPYTIVFRGRNVFSYIRTEDKKDYGDTRLLGKHSIGLGGHVTKEDGPNYIKQCLEREVTREEVRFSGEIGTPTLVGTLFATNKPVDRVHFGLIYTIQTNGDVVPNERSISRAEFVPIDDMEDGYMGAKTETWSRILIPHLEAIYEISKAHSR